MNSNTENALIVDCPNCNTRQTVSIINPVLRYKFNNPSKLKDYTENLKFGDIVKRKRNIKCNKCNEVIFTQTLVLVVNDGWTEIIGVIE